jgi:hypothetical protein
MYYFKITKTWAIKCLSENDAFQLIANNPDAYLESETVSRTVYKTNHVRALFGRTEQRYLCSVRPLLGLLEIFIAGAPALLGTAVEMPFDLAVRLGLAPAPFALIVQRARGGGLLIGEANVRRQRWHTRSPLLLSSPDAPALVKEGAAMISIASIEY